MDLVPAVTGRPGGAPIGRPRDRVPKGLRAVSAAWDGGAKHCTAGRGTTMRILPKVGALGAAYTFLRSPAGRRLLDELKRQAADPENRRRAAELINRVRGRGGPTVVDAEPPGR